LKATLDDDNDDRKNLFGDHYLSTLEPGPDQDQIRSNWVRMKLPNPDPETTILVFGENGADGHSSIENR
jgi:hypothetical protein